MVTPIARSRESVWCRRSACRAMLEFEYDDADRAWRLNLPPVPVWRLEYRLELRHEGHTEVICDPANPQRAPGGFGEKSVIELAGYHRPDWLDLPGAPGEWRDLTVAIAGAQGRRAGTHLGAARSATGILLAHDGGEFDRLIGLSHYSAAMVAAGAMPPHHLVLLSPVDRNDWYSANPAYARALAERCAARGPGRAGHRRSGRRARRKPGCARPPARAASPPAPVRRNVPAVGQLLPAPLRRPGVGLPALPPDRPLRRRGATASARAGAVRCRPS